MSILAAFSSFVGFILILCLFAFIFYVVVGIGERK